MYQDNPNKCASCGKIYPYEVRHHSGSRECGDCWSWRKLDGNMARYWRDKINALWEEGPDMYDVQTWTRMGILEEMTDAIYTFRALAERMEFAIETDGNNRRDALGYSRTD